MRWGVRKNNVGVRTFLIGVRNCIKIVALTHIETTGLIQKISVLFSFLRAILLVLGLFCLNSGKVALFSLLFFVNLYLWKARTTNKKHELSYKKHEKHEYTIIIIYWPLAAMLVVFFYALENFFNFFQKIGWSKPPPNLHMVSKG